MKRLLLLFITFLFLGCGAVNRGAEKVAEWSSPKTEKGAAAPEANNPSPTNDQPKQAKETRSLDKGQQVSKPKKESAPGFIAAPNLSRSTIDKLWAVAKEKCYDLGYTLQNDDRSSKNLVFQRPNMFGGNPINLRVKFASDGIYISIKSNTIGDYSPLGTKDKAFVELKAAIEAALNNTN